jgi:hypothetical protein
MQQAGTITSDECFTPGSMALPLVSVVMPSFNQAEFIDASIRSVLSQSWSRLELLVQDGGSTDGTLEVLQAAQQRDARVRWVSEPDGGPADAVNRAMRRARGTLIGWLNSDDLYTDGAVARAVDALRMNREWLLVYGHGMHVDEAGRELAGYPTRSPEGDLKRFLEGCFICQPTVFFRHSMPILLGPLDVTLRTAFDFDYWLRAFTQLPGRIGFIKAVQAQSRLHQGCITRRMRRLVALEGLEVLRRHLRTAPLHWALTHLEEIRATAGADADGQMAEFVEQAAALLAPSDAQELRARAILHHAARARDGSSAA